MFNFKNKESVSGKDFPGETFTFTIIMALAKACKISPEDLAQEVFETLHSGASDEFTKTFILKAVQSIVESELKSKKTNKDESETA